MRNLLFALLAAAFLVQATGCSEDFEVSAPYKDVTFVYGLLNPQDTAHYIRIQKAFLDETKSAIDMAKEADSNFYKELSVNMKEMSGASVVAVIPLVKVDLNNEGYPKEPGSFFTGPSYAYKFKAVLHPAHTYRLVINNAATGKIDSSEINVLDPAAFGVPNFDLSTFKLNFAKTFPPTAGKYSLFGYSPPNTGYVEGLIRFRFVEKDNNTGESVDKSADFTFGAESDFSANGSFRLETQNQAFYSFLRDAMGIAPYGVERYLDSCDFYIYAGGKELLSYRNVTQVQSGGITADQIKPLFTNILGGDVYGIFSSRTGKARLNVPIDSLTWDSLRTNPLTAPLNIRGFSDH
jgi:hypothetical protein